MITPMEMYWITRLDKICEVESLLCVFSGIAILGALVIMMFNLDSRRNEEARNFAMAKKFMRIPIFIFCITAFLNILTPSKADIAKMYVIPAVLNNQDVQALPADLANLAHAQIEKLIGVKPEEKK